MGLQGAIGPRAAKGVPTAIDHPAVLDLRAIFNTEGVPGVPATTTPQRSGAPQWKGIGR